MNKSRRNFIRTGLGGLGTGVAASLTSSCVNFDRYFMGELQDGQEKVVILGAGASGLAAALALRKAKIPFRVFEASNRLGGRVYTISDFNLASQHAELGAEWILPSDETVLNLAQELRVSLREKKSALPFVSIGHGPADLMSKQLLSSSNLFRKVLAEAFPGSVRPTGLRLTEESKSLYPRAKILHEISAADLILRLKKDLNEEQIGILTAFSKWTWGALPEDISGLSFATRLSEPHILTSNRAFRFAGGGSVLARAMYDRLSGVLPGQFVKFEHELVKVGRSQKGFELSFKTPYGDRAIKAQMVICTLPVSCLRSIDGLADLELTESVGKWMQDLRYGSQTKCAFSFEEQGWRKNLTLEKSSRWLVNQNWYSVGHDSNVNLSSGKGVIHSLVGGPEGEAFDPRSMPKLFEELHSLKADSWRLEDNQTLRNWSKANFSKGSVSFLKPSGALPNLTALQDASRDWLFAGEHVSLSTGSLNSALESGFSAAQIVGQKLKA